MSLSYRNPICLRCGNDTVYAETDECIECGLDTEVFDIEHGWGDYHRRMKYRDNDRHGGRGVWKYVPEGCLAVFEGTEI